jgi:hypothetical protein
MPVDCSDLDQLAEDAKCWVAKFDQQQLQAVIAYLTCQAANAGGGGGGGAAATDQWLLSNVPAVQYTAQTRDGDNVVTVGTALWPDGSAGVYTLTTKNVTWLAADAWTLTHTDSGKTLTQAAVTRNGSGYETVTPVITIA